MSITANKEMQFWAEMRSTAYLFSKSTWPSAEQTGRLIHQLRDILGKRIIKYPQVFGEFGIGPDTPYHLKKAFLGIQSNYQNPHTEEADKRFLKFMVQKASEAQKGNWAWRVTQEAEQKQLEGWYPFFTTLTIDPKRCTGKPYKLGKETLPIYSSPRELWEKGREFRKFIRRLCNVVTSELGEPEAHKKVKNYKGTGKDYDYRPESDYITYAGVIEHGKSQQHHHAHIMIWMREIPAAWKIDPNQGRIPANRNRRENLHMRQYWKWSVPDQCPSLYFRTKGDIWSEMGHVTPIDDKGNPIKINQVQAVGNYVTKYMQKGNKIWHHRMKCTRNLGMKKIKTLIDSLTLEQLRPLAWRPEKSSHLRSVSSIHSVPQGLIRSLATRKLFAIHYHLGALELKDLMKTNYDHYRKMLKNVRDGARPDRMPSADFYDWVQKFLPETPEYCEKRLLDSHRLLAYDFPRPIHRIKPITIPGNESGFTQCI